MREGGLFTSLMLGARMQSELMFPRYETFECEDADHNHVYLHPGTNLTNAYTYIPLYVYKKLKNYLCILCSVCVAGKGLHTLIPFVQPSVAKGKNVYLDP